jgi:hypothetical protein
MENPLQHIFLTDAGGEKRGFPPPKGVKGKGAFNIDNSANPIRNQL